MVPCSAERDFTLRADNISVSHMWACLIWLQHLGAIIVMSCKLVNIVCVVVAFTSCQQPVCLSNYRHVSKNQFLLQGKIIIV